MTTFYTHYDSPIGRLLLTASTAALTGIYMSTEKHAPVIATPWRENAAAFSAVTQQLDEYFAGQRRTFDLPLSADGTPFQQKVWAALRTIPYGETWSYRDLAKAVGNLSAVRAVGTANGRNPLSIVVPCHRVIGSNGTLTGYAGGLSAKQWLLENEQAKDFLLT